MHRHGGRHDWSTRPHALTRMLPAPFLASLETMFSTHVTIYHHLISQAGWNRCNRSIYLEGSSPWETVVTPANAGQSEQSLYIEHTRYGMSAMHAM